MRRLTASTLLSTVALALSLATAATAGATISSIVTAPGRDVLATDRPIALQLKVAFDAPAPDSYTYQAYVWPSGTGPTLEQVPLTAQDPGAFQDQGGTVNATDGTRWASRPGTYWIGVTATPKPTPLPRPVPCPPQPVPEGTSTIMIACPQVSYAAPPPPQTEGTPHSKVTVHPPLTLMWARFVARQKAARIGWRSKAPLTCVAPFAPSAYACTLRWHVGHGHARRLVKRAVTVAQDTTTGLVTVTRA